MARRNSPTRCGFTAPYLESHRSLESQADWFGRRELKWRNSYSRIYLALTLYRLGSWTRPAPR
uniref:Transposase DDE domain-containing protein n=1 Tax=Phenylobacterium glaciei TaxID=2803784 RepID=A0A974P6H1_9CAUL|nr:hypothetical protein JKL49_11825 [Phenylobacterium glaciei]